MRRFLIQFQKVKAGCRESTVGKMKLLLKKLTLKKSKKRATKKLDVRCYAKEIFSEKDLPLFRDVIKAAEGGAFRAAYVMIWLTCAESLKRRFSDAQKRDHLAGKIVGEIRAKEQANKAVDKFILLKAKEYGFISDSEFVTLGYVYEMRCLYGHPYEEAPLPEQLLHAVATVTEIVLSKPVKLRHRYGEELLKNLLEKKDYLDAQEITVVNFVKEIIFPRFDEELYQWFLDKYWEKLEKISKEPSMRLFFNRGIWFSSAMICEAKFTIFTSDDFHERANKYPVTFAGVCSKPDIFEKIGDRAQDTLVGLIFTHLETHPSFISLMEHLSYGGLLSKRQNERFFEYVEEIPFNKFHSTKLSLKLCYSRLMSAIGSCNWYSQNPAIDFLMESGFLRAATLDREQQVKLGRNLLQAADGNAGSAMFFLKMLSQEASSWPFDMVRGIALEIFTNEENQIRFKVRKLHDVFSAIEKFSQKERSRIIEEIIESVNIGTPKDSFVKSEGFTEVTDELKKFKWTRKLIKSLKTKSSALVSNGDIK